jgi:hypothetical protein
MVLAGVSIICSVFIRINLGLSECTSSTLLPFSGTGHTVRSVNPDNFLQDEKTKLRETI